MKKQIIDENKPGWLFLDAEEAEKARHLFSDFEGVGTVDELGFGLLFDQVAADLFPWCSTLTTRARYYFFSLAIIKKSLSQACKPLSQIDRLDKSAVYKNAIDCGLKYQKSLAENEKYLGFMLYHKDRQYEGLFGKRKISNWYGEKTGRPFTKFPGILQNNSRYANRIYRGGCQELNMFREKLDEQRLLEYAVKVQDPFSSDWSQISGRVEEQISNLLDQWKKVELECKSSEPFGFKEALRKLEPSLKHFTGFSMTQSEAHFLFEKIRAKSPYLNQIPVKNLNKLMASSELNLLSVTTLLKNKDDKIKFKSAVHIDRITRPFRELYNDIVDQKPNETWSRHFDWEVLNESYLWLNSNCPYSHWANRYKDFLGEWIKIGSSNKSKENYIELSRKVKQRAQDEVRSRGKVAPHELTQSKKLQIQESGIKEELGFRESSFRLWNASRILIDITMVLSDV